MKEHPILFNAEMVRAILSGQKTQTRRVVKCAPDGGTTARWAYTVSSTIRSDEYTWVLAALDPAGTRYTERGKEAELLRVRCSYGQPGDRLWVRETYGIATGAGHRVVYRADGQPMQQFYPDEPITGMKWRPSIHMPRWASRITLEITNVRVERLQEISEADAKAEGTDLWAKEKLSEGERWQNSRMNFAMLWESVYGAGSWKANPWTWVISFKRMS